MKTENKTQLFLKSLGLYALLGFFLFANYFANYTNFHHHDAPSGHSVYSLSDDASVAHMDLSQEDEDCLICDFQSLVYHPLNQDFSIAKSPEIPVFVPINEYFTTHLSIGQKLSLLLRGPPYLA